MAGLTRKLIKDAAKDAGVEIPNEMIDAIINAHVESRDAAVEAATKPLNEQLEAKNGESGTDDYKTKWENEVKAHKATKDEYAAKETTSKKQAAYRALLTECNISEKRQDAILKVALATDFEGVEFDENNGIKNADKVKPAIATEWAAFVETTVTKNPTVPTPPKSEANPLAELQKQYDDATKAGRLPEAIAAKNKLFEAQKNGG